MSSSLRFNNNDARPSLPSSGYVALYPYQNGFEVSRASDSAYYVLMQVPTSFLTESTCLINGFAGSIHTDLDKATAAEGYRLHDGVIKRYAETDYTVTVPTTTYYLDFDTDDGTINWGETGARPTNRVPVFEATVDGSTQVTAITDKRAFSLHLKRPSMPVGTTGERPALAATGEFRYNTTTAAIECYDGSSWV